MQFLQTSAYRIVKVYGPDDARCHDHRAGLPADLAAPDDFREKMLHNDACLLVDGLRLTLHKCAYLSGSLLSVKFRIILRGLKHFIITAVWRIVFQHIENEPFLDSLFHRVLVERNVLCLAVW